MSDDLAFACPQCGEADGLVRVSRQESIFRGPVIRMHGLASSPWVHVDGDQETEFESHVRTLRVDCTHCGFTGQPALFVVVDPALIPQVSPETTRSEPHAADTAEHESPAPDGDSRC